MINKDNFHILNYIKKEEYVGSMEGMRYMLKKKISGDDTTLEVILWPEPFGYSKTSESKKQRMEFALCQEGLEEAIEWMNEQYVQQKELWSVM